MRLALSILMGRTGMRLTCVPVRRRCDRANREFLAKDLTEGSDAG